MTGLLDRIKAWLFRAPAREGVGNPFLITNTSADANAHHILLDWYEHTNRTA